MRYSEAEIIPFPTYERDSRYRYCKEMSLFIRRIQNEKNAIILHSRVCIRNLYITNDTKIAWLSLFCRGAGAGIR